MKQRGFGLVGVLVIVLALALVGGAGWYVWSQGQEEESEVIDTSQNAIDTNESSENTDAEIAEPSRTSKWLVVESGQKGFSVNVPDGWKIINVLDSNWLTVRNAENTTYAEGTPAEVEEFESYGTDGSARINIIRFDDDNFIFLDGDEENLGAFESKNVTGVKFYKQYSDNPSEGIGPLPGQQSYTYRFIKGDSTTFVTYNIQKGESDILDVVEDMISTLDIK